MFTFLNTVVFASLVGIFIPLILHLLNRQRRRNIQFSSIRFLKLLEKQRLKRLKLYQYLLILVRTLIFLFLVLAFARPTYTGENLIGGAARTTAVIIIDDAIQMRRYDDAGNRFHRAIQKAQEIVAQFQTADQVFLRTSHEPQTEIPDLTDIECSYASAEWEKVFFEVNKIFAAYPNYNRELYILSDFEFPDSKWEKVELPEEVRVYLFSVSQGHISNVSIDTLRFENSLFEIDNTVRLEVLLRNQNAEAGTDAECHLYVNGKRVSHQQVHLDPAESRNINLTFQPKIRGEVLGYVEISDDDLIADNRYYFAFTIPENIEVLYVDDTPSIFWKAAWQAIENNSNILVTPERYSSWGQHALNRFKTVCLINPTVISEIMTDRLQNYVSQGGGLILIPGMNTIPADFNRLFAKLKISTRIQDFVKAQDRSAYFTLLPPSLNHPLFSDLFRQDKPDLTKPILRKYLRFQSRQDQLPILSLNNGDPYLIQDGESVFVVASSFEEDWTDFQYRGLFIPLLVRLIYLGSAASAQNNLRATCGEEFQITSARTASEQYELLQPDGQKNRIAPVAYDPQPTFRLNQLSNPGHYTLLSAGNRLQTISVNVPARSIITSRVDFNRISKNILVFHETDPFSDTVLQARVGLELWKWFLVLVILMILAEFFLIKKTEGKN